MSNNTPQSEHGLKVYYLTLSVYRYIDIFTRRDYIELIIESFRLYQEDYGLILYDWIIMSNHIHFIASSKEDNLLELIDDFKKFTAAQFLDAVKTNPEELRKDWLLEAFKTCHKEPIFWRGKYHVQEIYKMDYYIVKQRAMYRDPLRLGLVADEKHYMLSSCACKYENKEGVLKLSTLLADFKSSGV